MKSNKRSEYILMLFKFFFGNFYNEYENYDCNLQNIGPSCGPNGPISRGLAENEKRSVVEMHNTYRSKVAEGKETRGSPGPQKPASDMLELTWDNELEAIAQR